VSFVLRVDQQRGMDLLRQSLGSGRRRPMLMAPTGFGKTVLAAAIVASALAKHRRVCFTVPAISLIDQTVEKFFTHGIRDIGVIQADHPMTNPAMPVQVASVQTLQKRGRIPPADLVIIDEAHRWYDFYSEWMAREDWRRVPFIGLSATPWTKGLGKYYDDLIIATTTTDLIKAGHLSPFRVFAPSHPDLSKVRTVAGDYHEGDLSKAMDKAPLTADIVRTWLDKAEGRPTFVFAVDRAHAQSLANRFQSSGVSTGYIDANTPRQEREVIRRKFHAKAIQVVCNVGCLTTGVDWDVRCIVLARPTKSEMLYVQMIGRGLRTAPGKLDCLVLDHSDTTLRLGFVTDIRQDTLDDGKSRGKAKPRDKKEPLPKECPSCGILKPAKVRKCPNCGFEAKPQSSEAQGSLAELIPGKVKADMEVKQSWYSMLLHYARRRGLKPGWVAHSYRKKFGVWPSRMQDVPIEPNAEVLGYIKHLMIAHAKSKRAA